MGVKGKSGPKLKNLDALFQLNDGENPLDRYNPIMDKQPGSIRVINTIHIDKLIPYDGHPFQLYEGERLSDMVASVKANGVLMPVIAREKEDDVLEILAGHNRVNAARIAGIEEIPAIILTDIPDEDAMVYIVETNLIQRSFSDMAHSEKAAVIALHHSKMFSQGKRNDILEQIKMLEKPHEYKENGTFNQVGEKFHSGQQIAETYSLSKMTVSRYLRIQHLISELKAKLDNGCIAFIPAVTLSFLKEAEQKLLLDFLEQSNLTVDMKKADMLRKYSEKGKLDEDSIQQILTGAAVYKPNRTPTVKINKTVYAKYFKQNQSAREVQKIVEKALDMYFESQ